MNVQGKVWGQTSKLFSKNNVEINRIVCHKDSFCSKHKHTSKYNMFFVERGTLIISVWKNDYNLVDETLLREHESCIVDPGEYHSFKCLEEGTVAFEIYWVEINEKDIERESVGGTSE